MQENKKLLQLEITGKCRLKFRQSPKKLTTFGLGGDIQLVIEPTSVSAISEIINYFAESKKTFRTLGAGSNVVISDNGITQPVIKLAKEFSKHFFVVKFPDSLDELTALEPKKETKSLVAFAGSSLMRLSRFSAEAGLSGLEFAAGIPASVGGAVAMNAGAHGGEIADCIKFVYLITKNGEFRKVPAKDFNFSYRHSAITRDEVIVAAGFELLKGDKEQILAKRKECLEYRKLTQPLTMPSSGSVFVNPENQGQPVYSAKLIEEIGLKGVSKGGVGFSEKHSNWLVRLNNDAKSSEFLYLIDRAKTLVKKEFKVDLRTEIKFWE